MSLSSFLFFLPPFFPFPFLHRYSLYLIRFLLFYSFTHSLSTRPTISIFRQSCQHELITNLQLVKDNGTKETNQLHIPICTRTPIQRIPSPTPAKTIATMLTRTTTRCKLTPPGNNKPSVSQPTLLPLPLRRPVETRSRLHLSMTPSTLPDQTSISASPPDIRGRRLSFLGGSTSLRSLTSMRRIDPRSRRDQVSQVSKSCLLLARILSNIWRMRNWIFCKVFFLCYVLDPSMALFFFFCLMSFLCFAQLNPPAMPNPKLIPLNA